MGGKEEEKKRTLHPSNLMAKLNYCDIKETYIKK